MAVNFKVPASPKRNISASDTFIGVDLTNTAVDMDGSRSPNAENMVRHVPGKVRKRMGYYKDILFGKKTNVNFAEGTSAKEKEIVITESTADTWVDLYDLIQTFTDVGTNYTIEFDYKAEYSFELNVSNTIPASTEWTHYSDNATRPGIIGDLSKIIIKSETPQSIFIKKFAFMVSKDSSYEWSPAPNYFVERESNDPVYGCHFLRKGDSFEGDRIKNVNRVLGTHDTFDEFPFSLSGSSSYTGVMYRTAEYIGDGVPIQIEFDYIYEGFTSVSLYVGQNSSILLRPTDGEIVHISETIVSQSRQYNPPKTEWDGISAENINGATSSNLKIRRLSITYEKDGSYTWSPAPEDTNPKYKYHVKDIYSVEPKDYALIDSAEDESSSSFSTTYSKTFNICNDVEFPQNYNYVSFDITTSTTNNVLTSITIKFWGPSSYEGPFFYRKFTEHLTREHFDVYINPQIYISVIEITYTVSGSTKAHTYISNIHLKKYSVRDSYYVNNKWYLYHVGKDFYLRPHDSSSITKAYEGANEHISKSFQLNNNAYIIDGKDIYRFSINEGESVERIDKDNAYIPLVTFAKTPSGGGTSKDALNLLQPGFYEQFIGETGVTQYQLSFNGLDDTPCRAWIKDSNGNWVVKRENVEFTVNRQQGKITFYSAPGAPPVTGEDNVRILAYRTIDDYRDRVTKCTVGVLFGVNGASDRLFLSGNPDHPNWDFYSQQYDPTYFPDLGYSVLGSEQSKIMGYAIVNNYLTTFKDGFDMSQSVFVREGDLLKTGEEEKETSEPVFKLINTLQGEGVLAPYTFGYLQTEPLFLTKAGIYAITEQDITGEKYTQNRSFYLDGKLRKEPNLENAIATVYDNQYVLSVNNQLYILDGLQATRTDKSEPYATRQYAGFHCKDIPATYIWTDDALCFGTADGKVCRFYTDDEALASYNDDGKPIYACWETPDLDGQLFYKNKTFRYFAVRLMKAIKTSVRLYSKKLGIWTLNDEEAWTFIKEQTAIANALNFESVDFDMFTFSVDTSEKVVHTKLRVKKVDKARFRVENDALNEPFGISDIALEYIESGNYKG